MASILVVDDSASVRVAMAHALARAGHQVDQADGVLSATATLAAKPVDVILTDLRMPGDGGDQLVRWARRHCPGSRIVVMSGDADALDRACVAADACLIKPFAPRDLTALVDRLLLPVAKA